MGGGGRGGWVDGKKGWGGEGRSGPDQGGNMDGVGWLEVKLREIENERYLASSGSGSGQRAEGAAGIGHGAWAVANVAKASMMMA